MGGFDEFFQEATGFRPHGYQARIARDGLPDVVQAPTGTPAPAGRRRPVSASRLTAH